MILYGTNWGNKPRVEIEMSAISLGGYWWNKDEPDDPNLKHGVGLYGHYKALQETLWPWKQWDKWSELILQNLVSNRMTVIIGPASSTKTHSVASFILCRYLLFPRNSCTLVSSTDSRSLELRIWGEIKKLWNEARARYPRFPGRMVESKQMLVTDSDDEEDATDYRNGIIGIPCMQGGTFVGIGKYVGIKSGNVFLAADELSFMPPPFYDAISNLSKNPSFRCAGMGNPKDRLDTLGKLAEPWIDPDSKTGGWESYSPCGVTQTWKTRFEGGVAIQLDGRDSPNNAAPPGDPYPFPYIINRDNIQQDIDFYGPDSIQVSMMDYGVFPRDAQARRVITRTMCERFLAMEEPFWSQQPLTKLLAIDAAYGAVGGDRCIGVELHFGVCTDGKVRMAFASQPIVIPVDASLAVMPEEQIVNWARTYCESEDRKIEPSHVGFDSTGRGSLVSAFCRLWSTDVVCVEFGGPPSDRQVSEKLQIPAKTYYYNFVSELWFTSAKVIESDQIRGMPTAVMEEGCLRPWDMENKKMQVMPKDEMKKKGQRSPDIYDSFVTGIEVARRLGFTVGTAGAVTTGRDWVYDWADRKRQILSRHALVYR